MNDDHADEALLICRVLGGVPDAERVVTRGLDSDAMHFTAFTGDAEREVSVPFAEPVHQRPQVRLAVVALHDRAREAAGC